MISFNCRCGYRFSVEEDQVNSAIQCPACGLLNDVPTHADLDSLAPDGTFQLGGPNVRPEPRRLEKLGHIYGYARHDIAPEDLDLRASARELDRIGQEALDPVQEAQSRRPLPPRYDPETGELLRPLDLHPVEELDRSPASIPLAKPVLRYARADLAPRLVTPRNAAVALLRPINLFVMFCILVAHVLLTVTCLTILVGFVFLIVAPFVLAVLLIGHYGVVIDEIGPELQDELPRPLRQLSWHDDTWGPFVHVAGAFLMAYGLAIVAYCISSPAAVGLAAVFGAFGAIVFPALLLTTTTSGTVHNLRPDRVWGVIRACGRFYPFLVIEGFVALVIYLYATLGTIASLVLSMGIVSWNLGPYGHWWVVYPMLTAGIFLMHLFCWHLGIAYRAHEPQFPWLLHRYVESRNQRAAVAPMRSAVPAVKPPMDQGAAESASTPHPIPPHS